MARLGGDWGGVMVAAVTHPQGWASNVMTGVEAGSCSSGWAVE